VRQEIFDESVFAAPYKFATDVVTISLLAVALRPRARALFDTIVYRGGGILDTNINGTWYTGHVDLKPRLPSVTSAFLSRDKMTSLPAIVLATSWNDRLISDLFDRVANVLLIISPDSDDLEGREPDPRILVLEGGYSLPEIYGAVDEAVASDLERNGHDAPADDVDSEEEEEEEEEEEDSD
jgi:hypothetical protein